MMPANDAHAISVLLVDDDPLVLAATARFLRKRGMRTICADSPFGVTALVRKETPDVVVLDCHMPGLDGALLMRVLRTSPRTAETPIVFYSGDTDAELAELADALGTYYAPKARGPVMLADTITRAVRGHANGRLGPGHLALRVASGSASRA
ncbi:MAG: response regulator [Polyangiaceae bacterium]